MVVVVIETVSGASKLLTRACAEDVKWLQTHGDCIAMREPVAYAVVVNSNQL